MLLFLFLACPKCYDLIRVHLEKLKKIFLSGGNSSRNANENGTKKITGWEVDEKVKSLIDAIINLRGQMESLLSHNEEIMKFYSSLNNKYEEIMKLYVSVRKMMVKSEGAAQNGGATVGNAVKIIFLIKEMITNIATTLKEQGLTIREVAFSKRDSSNIATKVNALAQEVKCYIYKYK